MGGSLRDRDSRSEGGEGVAGGVGHEHVTTLRTVRQLRVHASRFSRALIDLKRTAGGDAVAFQPDSPNLFLAHLVVEHVDWRENWKSLFDRHLHHRIDRILPAFLAPQRFR